MESNKRSGGIEGRPGGGGIAEGRPDGYVSYEIKGEWFGGFADRDMMVWDLQATNPVARATTLTPPYPISRASAAAHCRRRRSSNSGATTRYLRRTRMTADGSRTPQL